MAGDRKKLPGRQEDIRLQVTLSLCKNIVPETYCLNAWAYLSIASNLSTLGVSPRYVGDI